MHSSSEELYSEDHDMELMMVMTREEIEKNSGNSGKKNPDQPDKTGPFSRRVPNNLARGKVSLLTVYA